MSNDRRITNTSKVHEEAPMLTLAEAMLFGASGAIERSEAIGQVQLVESTDLPADGSDNPAFASFGVTFGEPHADDPIFRPATLPAGWKKQATDHSMWSKLIDDKGRERAHIFYKAAFYDRSAHINPNRRFSVARDYDVKADDDAMSAFRHRVLDCGQVVFETAIVNAPKARAADADWEREKAIRAEQEAACQAWLVEHGYENWGDCTAYWDAA